MADKPASRPIAKAIRHPSGRGHAGQFALPGLVPDMVRSGRGVDQFDDETQAMGAALKALFNVLVSRTTDTRKAGGYRRMTGAELAIALTEAEVTPTEFAELCGVPQSRVMKWLDGEQDIPHSALILVRLLAYEENYKEARAITDRARQEGSDDGREG